MSTQMRGLRALINGPFSQAPRWLGKGVWAVLDQGLFSVSNFVLNIALARSLGSEEYGAFSVAYASFLLLGTIHMALLAEPMLVFGPGRYREQWSGYFRALMVDHWLLSAGMGACLALGGVVVFALGPGPLATSLMVLGGATPLILFQWLVRRACYVQSQPQLAAVAGILYLVLLVTMTMILDTMALLSAATAILTMASVSLVCGTWLWFRLRGARGGGGTITHSEIRKEHWRYGRWSSPSALVSWAEGNAFSFIIPLVGGLALAGTYKALTNLLMPALLFFNAFNNLLLPSLVRTRNTPKFVKLIGFFALLLVAGATTNWIVLGVLGPRLVSLLYGGIYVVPSGLLWLMGLMPIMAAVTVVGRASVGALERPRAIFMAYAVSTVVAIPLGLVLIAQWGLAGAFTSLLISGLVAAGILFATLRRVIRQVPRGNG